MPRNVSFASSSDDSTAYREHNPPAVLRRQEAARREMSPPLDANTEDAHRRRSIMSNTSSGASFSSVLGTQGSQPPASPGTNPSYPSGLSIPPPGSLPPSSMSPTILQTPRSSDSYLKKMESQQSLLLPLQQQTAQEQVQLEQQQAKQAQQAQQAQQVQAQQAQQAQQVQQARQAQAQQTQQAQQAQQVQQTQAQQTQQTQARPTQQSQQRTARSTQPAPRQQRQGSASPSPQLAPQQGPVPDNKTEEVHILVAVTGSVATIKLPQIIHKLKQIYRKRAVIQVVVTRASTIFFDADDLPRDIKVWHDSDEWKSRQLPNHTSELSTHSDQQLHIKLRRWADILLVAPCSANTLAKFSYGICDNLLTSIFRVWNPEVPIILAPAMNTHMYTNPVTKTHFNILKQSFPFVEILKPVEKVLVCGDIGMGGMREWTDIVQVLVKRVGVALDEEDSENESESD